MPSLILRTATSYLVPILLIFAVFLLLRGHNEPGGGFVSGLVVAIAFTLYTIAYGVQEARRALWVDPMMLIGFGLLIVLSSGVIGLLNDQAFLTGVWLNVQVPAIGKLGTPVLFDLGVDVVVIGVAMLIIFSLAEAADTANINSAEINPDEEASI